MAKREGPPRAPRGAKAGGRRLWSSVVDLYELEVHEEMLLREAVRCVDQLDALAVVVEAEGVLEPGIGRAHPAVVEARQLRLVLGRTLAMLRLPSGDEDAARPQRRGPRGVYAVGGGPARPRSVG